MVTQLLFGETYTIVEDREDEDEGDEDTGGKGGSGGCVCAIAGCFDSAQARMLERDLGGLNASAIAARDQPSVAKSRTRSRIRCCGKELRYAPS
jgi:hypothetical protein